MIKNMNEYKKSRSCESCNDFDILTELSNPYNYSFKAEKRHIHSCAFNKLHNKVNFDYFNGK